MSLLLLWIATGAALAGERPIQVSVTPIPLSSSDTPIDRLGRLGYLAGFQLRSDDDAFGGISGLLIEGDALLAITDRGDWLSARLDHDATGRLVGLSDVTVAPMTGIKKTFVAHTRRDGDAESVARLPDGRLAVGFENNHRLWVYAPGDDPARAKPSALPSPPGLDKASSNGGLEALEVDAGGRLLALTEKLRDGPDTVGWLRDGAGWQRRRYATDGAYVPTDLARLPSGDMLVLERRFSLLGGVAAQVRLIPRAQLDGPRLEPLPVARLVPPVNVDNMEGLAVAERAGETLVYMVSDDNFSPLQRTLLLQFRLLPAE